MLVVNLFGSPGTGKSTGAAYIFSQLKMQGINTELVTEFAKDKVWEESKEVFNNQIYIFGKQSFRLSKLKNKVDVVITDSPLPLSIIYNNDENTQTELSNLVWKVFNSYSNLNIFLTRVKPYHPEGRFQTEEESDKIANNLLYFLKNNKVIFLKENADLQGYNNIVNHITRCLSVLNNKKED